MASFALLLTKLDSESGLEARVPWRSSTALAVVNAFCFPPVSIV